MRWPVSEPNVLCLRSEYMHVKFMANIISIYYLNFVCGPCANETREYIYIHPKSLQPQTHFGTVDGAFSLFNQPRSIEADRPTNANARARTSTFPDRNQHPHLNICENVQRKCYANQTAFCLKIGASRARKGIRAYTHTPKTRTTTIWKTLSPDVLCCCCCCCCNIK